MAYKKLVLGIFSRDHEDSYKWLLLFLLTISRVKDVRTVSISNNFHHFQQEAFKCNFAILYHSKSRGRVNVTDVTDSLYDAELEHLNRTLGKKKVLVVIDDLEDSSEDAKFHILHYQPRIGQLAQELFIFSTAEKSLLNVGDDHFNTEYLSHPELRYKMEKLKRLIAGKKTSGKQRAFRPVNPVNEAIGGEASAPRPGDLPTTRPWWCQRRLCAIVIVILLLVLLTIVLATTLHK